MAKVGGGLLGPYDAYRVTRELGETVEVREGAFIIDALAPLANEVGAPDAVLDKLLSSLRSSGVATDGVYLYTLIE